MHGRVVATTRYDCPRQHHQPRIVTPACDRSGGGDVSHDHRRLVERTQHIASAPRTHPANVEVTSTRMHRVGGRGQLTTSARIFSPATEHHLALVELREQASLALTSRRDGRNFHGVVRRPAEKSRSPAINDPTVAGQAPRHRAHSLPMFAPACYRPSHFRGTSSVGRARASQARGHEFEPRVPLKVQIPWRLRRFSAARGSTSRRLCR